MAIKTPIAKIVPLTAEDLPAEQAALAAEGKIRLPRRALPASFWSTPAPHLETDRALEILREDRDAR